MSKKNKILYYLTLIFSVLLCVVIESILLINTLSNATKENMFDFIISMLFTLIIFSLIVFVNIKFKKQIYFVKRRKITIFFIFQCAFILCSFVGLLEAGFDSRTTSEQVKNVLNLFTGENKNKPLESFEIKINNKKEEYDVNDIIDFEIKYQPYNTTDKSIMYEIDNNIVDVDIYNKKISCNEEGSVTITFISAYNKEIKTSINLNIKKTKTEQIIINEDKDLFLNISETYKLKEPTILPINAHNKEYQYISTNPSIATIDSNGNIKALNAGTTIIKCFIEDIYDEIYITVNPVKKLEINDKEIELNINEEKEINVLIDNMDSFNQDNLSIIYSKNLDFTITNIDYINKIVTLKIKNNLKHNHLDKNEKVEIIYKFLGGYKISEQVNIILKATKNLLISDIDLSKTSTLLKENIYYYNDSLVTKFINIPIYYKDISNQNITNYYIETSSDVDVSLSKYNLITVDLENVITLDNIYIYFYPTKEIKEYILFEVEVNKIVLNKEISDCSFSLNNLYEINEQKKNEIWYSYLDENLFNDFVFEDSALMNTGLIIEPTDETKKYINFSTNKFGFVEKIDLIDENIENNITLEFDIYSLYDYENNQNYKKHTYIINVIKNYDDIKIKIDDGILEDKYIQLECGKTINFDVEVLLSLEYKGTYQNNIEYIYSIDVDTSKIVNIKNNKITGLNIGNVNLIVIANNIKKEIQIEVVNEEGILLTPANIIVDNIEYDEKLIPDMNNHKYGIGTTIYFSTDKEGYKFVSTDSSIVSITENGVAKCLKSGKTKILVIHKDNINIQTELEMSVYEYIYPFSLKKGNFRKMTFEDDLYTFVAKKNKTYQFKIKDNKNEYEYIYKLDNNNPNVQIGTNGSIIIKSSGTYYGTIQIGEDDSPYKQSIRFKIVCTDNGFTNEFLYFMRKAMGHFGLFMVIGIFISLTFFGFSVFKKYQNIILFIIISIYGVFLAYTTEYIQKLDPTRTYSLKDVLIDSCGFFSGVVVTILITIIVKEIIFKKRRNSNERTI